jgi:hypothetical protein
MSEANVAGLTGHLRQLGRIAGRLRALGRERIAALERSEATAEHRAYAEALDRAQELWAAWHQTEAQQHYEALLNEEARWRALEEGERLALRGAAAAVAETAKPERGAAEWLGLHGLGLRVSKRWAFDVATAEAWARENAPTLIRLDTKGYAAAAGTLPGAPGHWDRSYTVALSIDLSAWDDGEAPDADGLPDEMGPEPEE